MLDRFRGRTISGDGETASSLRVDKDHQYVSAVTMLAPSRDRMMGVSLLRLCDGSDWKRYVKVCGELFSTATRSPRVAPRNSIQATNSSFGYFEFTFQRYDEPLPVPFPAANSTACQPEG